ncbi:nitrate- and nitrite sensing domain-containing protein [Roseibium sp. LAB1]
MTIEEACRESRHASEILPIAEMAKKSEAVLHELQKERGRTAVLIASEYAVEPQGLLQEQRAATDEVVEQLVSGPSVDQVATEMADGIEGYLEEMTRDVEERCRASRKQEMGQQVKLVTQVENRLRPA